MFDKAQLRSNSLPASMLLDCKYRNFWRKFKNRGKKSFIAPLSVEKQQTTPRLEQSRQLASF